MTYLYPQNLKATANLWLWSLRDCGAGAASDGTPRCGHALLWVSDHPAGGYHGDGLYPVRRAVLCIHPAIF